eukprot:scaffold6430_cov135-Skeletonema_dohrnii-CCMP3373.AAC.3
MQRGYHLGLPTCTTGAPSRLESYLYAYEVALGRGHCVTRCPTDTCLNDWSENELPPMTQPANHKTTLSFSYSGAKWGGDHTTCGVWVQVGDLIARNQW